MGNRQSLRGRITEDILTLRRNGQITLSQIAALYHASVPGVWKELRRLGFATSFHRHPRAKKVDRRKTATIVRLAARGLTLAAIAGSQSLGALQEGAP